MGVGRVGGRDGPGIVAFEDESDRRMTFDEYQDAAEAVASGLLGCGVGPGSTVSWQLPTAIDTMVLVAALARLGATQNPIIPILRHRDVATIVEEARADLFVVRPEFGGFDFAAMAHEVTQGTSASVLAGVLPTGDPSTLPPPPARATSRAGCTTPPVPPRGPRACGTPTPRYWPG